MNNKTKCPYCLNGYGIKICEYCKAAIPEKENKDKNRSHKEEKHNGT